MKSGMPAAAFRMFIVQGSLNYERLQGIGTAVALEPLLRDIDGGPEGEAYRRAMGRGASFFNCHPYLAGIAIGALAKAEHMGLPEAQLHRLRSALRGSLGSFGDRLVWVGVLPASVALGLILAANTSPLVAIGVFFIVFNTFHFTLRFWGLGVGWRLGTSVAQALKHPILRGGLRVAGPLAALALGIAIPVVADWLSMDLDAFDKRRIIGVTSVTVVTMGWLMPTIGAVRFGLLATVATLLSGWIWQL